MATDVEVIAKVSAEHLSILVRLTEIQLVRKNGLASRQKLLTIMAADVQHVKAIYQVVQAELPPESRMAFSKFLRSLAETEEQEETEMQKGGDIPPAAQE